MMFVSSPVLAGDFDYQVRIAKTNLQKSDYAAMFKQLQPLANKGDAQAQFELAKLYQNGLGTQENKAEAFSLYSKAAEKNNKFALEELAWIYSSGDAGYGVKQDFSKAIKLYRQAIDAGNLGANLGLGVLYWKGTGVKKDRKKAEELFSKAVAAVPSSKSYVTIMKIGNP